MRNYIPFFFSIVAACLLTSCRDKEKRKPYRTVTKTHGLMLTDSQIKLANIATQKVALNDVGQSIALNARISLDEDLSSVITSKAAGRIERLGVKETGSTIKQGDLLYVIYSETLLTLQQEYLLAKEQYETLGKTEKRYASFYQASEKKLLLYGFSKGQVEQLSKSKSAQSGISFFAPSDGIVTEINVSEGNYVSEGSPLYKIEDTRTVWVEAELYPQESSLVKQGDHVSVVVAGFESTPVVATVTFLSPEYRVATQLISLRAALKNTDMRFAPGMQAQVLLKHSTKHSLAVPVDAVMRDGTGARVYVRRGVNTFEPRMVKTGLEDFDQVEITEGLTENDTIAVRGVYLLHSEFITNQ